MKRAAILAIGISCTACDAISSLFGSPPPAPAPAAHEVVAPAPPAPAPAPHAPARPRILNSEQARARRLAVAEGREAAHDGQYPEALAAFDRALAIEPRNPRLLCESGLVAHQAGQDALAARRIDGALALFGNDAFLPSTLHVPVAMCLYNRGLVHEAAGELDEAEDAYERSLALRASPVVSARREALGLEDRDTDPVGEGTSGGVRVSPLGFANLVHAPDEATLIRALESGLSGTDDFDDGAIASARIERSGAALPLPWPGFTELALFMADDGGVPVGDHILAITAHGSDGYQVVTLQVGAYDATDHGHYGDEHATVGEITTSAASLTIPIEICGAEGYQTEVEPDDMPTGRGDLVSCYETYDSGESCMRRLIVCGHDTVSIRCAAIDVQRSTASPPTSTFSCETDEDEMVDIAHPVDPADDVPAAYELRCGAADLDHIHCERVAGTDGEELVGDHTLDALREASRAELLSDWLRRDGDEDDEEGDETY
jgi:hypothetical protein